MDEIVDPLSSDSSASVCSTFVLRIESVRLNASAVVTAIDTSDIVRTKKSKFGSNA